MNVTPEVASAVAAVAHQATDSGDPVLSGIGYLGAVFAGVMMAGMPIMHYLRRWNENKAANAQDTAEANLYKTLSEQLERMQLRLDTLTTRLEEVNEQHNEQVRINAKLEAKAQESERMAQKIQRMTDKLDTREQEIRDLLANHSAEREQWMGTIRGKDQIILSQEQRIRQLETSVRDLELRLIRDDREKLVQKDPKGGEFL